MEKYFKLHLYYASAAIVLLITVGFASLMPSDKLPETEFNHIDKLTHLTMYFILSILIAKGFFNLKTSKKWILLIPIILSFFYSFLIEILQDVATSSRFFDIFDILANGIGCLIALAVLSSPFLNKK